MILLLKDKTSFFQIIFIILAGLTGCKHEDLQNKSEMILSFENVHSQPWVILENEQTVNGLIAMCYQSESNTLFSVDREFGSLVQWDLNTFSVVKVHDLEIKETNALRFSKNCRQIYGASEIETRKGRHGIEFNYFDNILVWDTKTGNVNDCIGDCEGKQKNPTQIGYIVNDKNNNYMNYYETSYSLFKNETWYFDQIVFIRGGDETEPTIGQIEFLPESERFVIAYLEGGVSIGNYYFLLPRLWVQKNMGSEKHVVSNLTVDSTGKRIARIWNDKLHVWEVDIFGKEELLSIQVEKDTLIVFDQSGIFLGVYGDQGCKIWDLNHQEIITTIKIPFITKMIFSQDNRLLFIGDKYGKIYIFKLG